MRQALHLRALVFVPRRQHDCCQSRRLPKRRTHAGFPAIHKQTGPSQLRSSHAPCRHEVTMMAARRTTDFDLHATNRDGANPPRRSV